MQKLKFTKGNAIMKAISSAIFSMSEQQAVFEQENSCREARPWQEKREKEPRIGETVYPV